jgi:hypothetical protein
MCHPVVLIVLFGLLTYPALADPTISIFEQPAYLRQRDCVKLCYRCTTPCPVVHGVIGCGGAPYDTCFCRDDLRSSASSFITSCIDYRCSGAKVDLSSALSLYNGYCHLDGAILGNAIIPSTDAITTMAGGGPTAVVVVTTVIATSSKYSTSPHGKSLLLTR